MEPFAIDLTLEETEGSVHNLGNLMLYCRLRADEFNPLEPAPEFTILYRDSSWNLQVKSVRLENQQLAELINLLRTCRFTQREIQIAPASGNPTGWQEVRFEVALDGKTKRMVLILQYGGIEGPDADAVRKIWKCLSGLAGLEGQDRWITGTN